MTGQGQINQKRGVFSDFALKKHRKGGKIVKGDVA
jgi:hypothetical protein